MLVFLVLIPSRPKAGGSLLEQVKNAADMASQQLSRPEREESGMTPPTLATRSTTPSSSSVKTKVSRPVPYVTSWSSENFMRFAHRKPPDPEAGPPDLRRSLRQSTARREKSPLPPSPTIAEPDDLCVLVDFFSPRCLMIVKVFGVSPWNWSAQHHA